jgi:hypothetical protein
VKAYNLDKALLDHGERRGLGARLLSALVVGMRNRDQVGGGGSRRVLELSQDRPRKRAYRPLLPSVD